MILTSSKTSDAQTILLQTRKAQAHYQSWLSSSICNVIVTVWIKVSGRTGLRTWSWVGMCLPSIHEAWVQSPTTQQQWCRRYSQWDWQCQQQQALTATPLCASGPHTRYTAAVAWSCLMTLGKNWVFRVSFSFSTRATTLNISQTQLQVSNSKISFTHGENTLGWHCLYAFRYLIKPSEELCPTLSYVRRSHVLIYLPGLNKWKFLA